MSPCRYKSTYDQYSGVTTLTILDLRAEDEGEYTCTAINSQGEVSTGALLLGPDRYAAWLAEQHGEPTPAPQPKTPLLSELEQRLDRPMPEPKRYKPQPDTAPFHPDEVRPRITSHSHIVICQAFVVSSGFK